MESTSGRTLHESRADVESRLARIEIFGLGYVGFPLSVRVSSARFHVTGIDTNRDRIKRLSESRLCNSELKLKGVFLENRKSGYLSLDSQSRPSPNTRIGIICVPTLVPRNGIDSSVHVVAAVRDFLKSASAGDLVIIESSVEVGTTDEIKKMIESSGYRMGLDFGLAFCPERIDPQNRKWNLENIPRIIYCSDDTTFSIAEKIYHHINNSNLMRVSSAKTAEVVKSFENTFRLVNVSLVNELAVLCDRLGISVSEVIGAAATKPFGFMPFYPGAGAGGHCVPKDPQFLLESAKKLGLDFGSISKALQTNAFVPRYIFDSIDRAISEGSLKRSVLVCGLAYKPDIEDMRDSPAFKVIGEFAANGYDVYAYDPYFDGDLIGKYLVENSMTEKNFTVLPDLADGLLRDISCICIVQHHAKTRFRLNRIYEESVVKMIYDCQKKILFHPGSKTVLKYLG